MNYFTSTILLLTLFFLTGIWLNNILPMYGSPLGIGIGVAFIIGLFTKKLK